MPLNSKKPTILVADDSAMNRAMLQMVLGDTYDIIEVEDGEQAIAALQRHGLAISLVLLDLVMPHMDGFEVLRIMNKQGWIQEIPVIMVTSEDSPEIANQAFDMGVSDFLNRPYNEGIVRRRVHNTLMLDAKQKALIEAVTHEVEKREKDTSMMVGILSHIVEFRNGESGQHVLHVNALTELMLGGIMAMTDAYDLTPDRIELIKLASSLHDIGKIAIDDKVLNKPGRLTDEEFDLMKQHTVIGAEMLDNLSYSRDDEPLIEVAYQICRWHHERYDGRGYPDGLKGDEIPIAAQVVALADVYDALTSPRVYKEAFSHEKSIEMILNGECGSFNPLLLDCLKKVADEIQDFLANSSYEKSTDKEVRKIIEEILGNESGLLARRSQELLDFEHRKYQFFASMSHELQFSYMVDADMLTIDDWSESGFDLPTAIVDPLGNEQIVELFGRENIEECYQCLHQTTPQESLIERDIVVTRNNTPRWYRVTASSVWSEDEDQKFLGAIGKLVDIHDHHEEIKNLEYKATHDALTGLTNRAYAEQVIVECMDKNPEDMLVLLIFDVDNFKTINDTYGHQFGDKILRGIGQHLQDAVRSDDIVARVGGDEFLVCMRCSVIPEPLIDRVYHAVNSPVGDFPVSISMGGAYGCKNDATYDQLFFCADDVLYSMKETKEGGYRIYNPEKEGGYNEGHPTTLSEID